MLKLLDVSKQYDDKWALQRMSLDFDAGKTHVLVGPSGCGKSTLLRIAIGLVVPDSGTVYLDDQQVTRRNINDLRHKIGYVIQEGGLFPHLTAADNTCLMARFLDWPTKQLQDRLLYLSNLTHFPQEALQRFPAELSGGQRQRVSLMRALMLDPDLLLMDEPLGALDPMIRSELQTDLRSVFRALEKTVVFVTHDMSEASYFGDSVMLLREGRVVQRGTAHELATQPADPFVTQFLRAQRGLWEGSGE